MSNRREPPVVSSKDARSRFAELLRRAEQDKERIRLTRRGKPIAYVVPLEDVERLRRLDDRYAAAAESGGGAGNREPSPREMRDPDEDMRETPRSEAPEDEDEDDRRPQTPHHEMVLHNHEEDERDVKINAFKKSLTRIFNDSDVLTRGDITRKLKHDNYVSSSVLRIIGEER